LMILANKMTLVRNMALVSEKKTHIICANYITTINERA